MCLVLVVSTNVLHDKWTDRQADRTDHLPLAHTVRELIISYDTNNTHIQCITCILPLTVVIFSLFFFSGDSKHKTILYIMSIYFMTHGYLHGI